jgi:hypothetical protein
MDHASTAARIVYPLYLEVDAKVAEDLQRRIQEALEHRDAVWEESVLKNVDENMDTPLVRYIKKIREQHAREIENMCKDAWDEATRAILDGRRTVGYCSFCNKSLVCHTLSEAQEKQREHTLRCPEMHKALASIAEYHAQTSREHEA